MQPLISVVIPSYNHEDFIARAIESVLTQEYNPIELVIVDDGSTDQSLSVIKATLQQFPDHSIQLIEQENQGAHTAIMRGIDTSTGDLISILNSDDYYLPQRFARMASYMDVTQAGLSFSALEFIDEYNKVLPVDHDWPVWYYQARSVIDSNPSIGYALFMQNFSVTSGNFLFTRILYEKLEGFSQHKFLHDWDFLIRSIYFCEPVWIDEILMSYRVHSSNTTETVRDLLLSEASDAVNRYAELYAIEANSPNPLAPCQQNWPNFFPYFSEHREAYFGSENIKNYFNSHLFQPSGLE